MENRKSGRVFLFAFALMMIFSVSCGNKSEKNITATKEVSAKSGKIEIMPVKDVKPGMTGYGLTVYRGAMPEKFFFKVLGVKKMLLGAASDLPVVIAQMTAGPKDFSPSKTGVVGGMSGSPTYINGKLVGALAFGFTLFSKDPIFGIQPAELMLNPQSAMNQTGVASFLDDKYIPLVLSAPRAIADSFSKNNRLNDIFKNNFVIQSAVGFSADAATSGNLRMQPGSSLQVYLVKGDIELAATGTVTMVDGDKIYAFGHSFLGIGEIEMPFHQNEIIIILSSYLRSNKMAGGIVGTAGGIITNDTYSAISGRIGKISRMLPISISLNGAKGSRTVNAEFIRSRNFTPRLIGGLIPEIISGIYGEAGFASLGQEQKINAVAEFAFDNKMPPLAIEKNFNLSAGREILVFWKCGDLLEAATAALIRKNMLSSLFGINIKIAIAETKEENNVSAKDKKPEFGAAGDIVVEGLEFKGAAIPGQIFSADVLLSVKKDNKKTTYTITTSVPIPEDIKPGDEKINISVGSGFAFANKSDTDNMDAKEMIAYYNNLFKPGLFLAVQYSVKKEEKINETAKNKAVELHALGTSSVKKIVTSKTVRKIYSVPLPAIFDPRADFKGQQEKDLDVKKEGTKE